MTNRSKLGAMLGLVGLAMAGCHAAGDAHADAAHAEGHHAVGVLPVTHPVRQSTERIQEYVAQIRAVQHIEVRALERGYLQDIYVDEGQQVTAGDRMFQVMPSVYRAERNRAAGEASFAQIEYDNTASLAEQNVVSPNELLLKGAELAKAKAELELASAHYDLAQIRAPFDGIMGRLEVRRGSLLEEGELLTTLSDNSEMWVYFNVSEAEYLSYKKRMDQHNPFEVKLRLANGEIFEQTGSVKVIEADFNPETGNIAFRATFPNPTGLLRHGETGNVLVSTILPDAMVIPQIATFEVLDKTYVYVVDEEGVVHARQVSIQAEVPHRYVVSEGLEESDRILLDGLRKVRDGQHLQVEEQEALAVLDGLGWHAE